MNALVRDDKKARLGGQARLVADRHRARDIEARRACPADSIEAAGYIADMLTAMRAMAEDANLHFLRYLLGIALAEAKARKNRRA